MHDVVRFVYVLLKSCKPGDIDECIGQYPRVPVLVKKCFYTVHSISLFLCLNKYHKNVKKVLKISQRSEIIAHLKSKNKGVPKKLIKL